MESYELTDEEFRTICDESNKVYEIPGFAVTIEDTAKWSGVVSAKSAHKAQKKLVVWLYSDCTDKRHSIAGSFGSHCRIYCADCMQSLLKDFGIGDAT